MRTVMGTTGDKNADSVLRFVASRADCLPQALRDDFRDGRVSMFMNYRFIAAQSELAEEDVRAALAYLHQNDYLRVDAGWYGHGETIWLRCRFVETAAA